MIVTKRKVFKKILDMLKNYKNIFIVGCSYCATICMTGGEEQIQDMCALLKNNDKKITGTTVLEPACHIGRAKQFYQNHKDRLAYSDAVLAMTCGNGVQTIFEAAKGKPVFPALDAMFLGKVERRGVFSQNCSLCGDCFVHETAGICPLAICSKMLLNGPCGGSKNGKCEVEDKRDCGWLQIYNKLKSLGRLDNMRSIKPAKDNSKSIHPQQIGH